MHYANFVAVFIVEKWLYDRVDRPITGQLPLHHRQYKSLMIKEMYLYIYANYRILREHLFNAGDFIGDQIVKVSLHMGFLVNLL